MGDRKTRLDQILVEMKLASSRTRAQDLIDAGQVEMSVENRVIKNLKASTPVPEGALIQLLEGPADRYVSRGGLKIEGAFARIGESLKGRRVLDIGQSTGGFTDYCLKQGAELVVGVDVGRDQLHPSLRSDPRVHCFEKLHVADLPKNVEIRDHFNAKGPDWIVVDVSFISLIEVLKVLPAMVSSQTRLLALVKPQFEVGPEGLGKGGLVRDPLLLDGVESRMKSFLRESGWKVLDYFPCALAGKDGNQEFFVYANDHQS